MNLNQLDFVSLIHINFLTKAFEGLFLIIFIVYSLLTLREVAIMNQTLVTNIAFGVRLGALVQFLLAILGLILVILI